MSLAHSLRGPSPRTRPALAFAIVATVVYVVDGFLLHSSAFARAPEQIAAAASIDLTVVLTFAYWFLFVRSGHAAARTVLPVFLATVAVAALVLPAGYRDVLRDLRYFAIPFELAIIGLVVVGVRRTQRALAAAGTQLDVPERIRAVLLGGTGERIADIVATELAILFYALASWRRKPFAPNNAAAFSYHRKNAMASILYAVFGAALVEMTALDFLLRSHHHTIANVLLALDAFGALWIFGFARSVQLRPIFVSNGVVHIRSGLRLAIDVPLGAIASTRFGRFTPPAKGTPGYVRGALGQPNALLTLREPIVMRGAYGMTRPVDTLGLFLDDVAGFKRVLLPDADAR